MIRLLSCAVTLFLFSCGSQPLHEKCTRENAVDRAVVVTWSEASRAGVLPSGWTTQEWGQPSYKAVEVNGDVFILEDTARFTTRYLDSTVAIPFKVTLKCAFDGKMEATEKALGQPSYTVDLDRLNRRMEEQRLLDSLQRIDLSFD